MRLPLAVALFSIGCAQAPDQELEMAAQRVAKAREAGASIYAPELLTEAERALETARENLSERDYRAAIRAAAFACVRADEARAIAVQRRKKPAADAQRLILEIEALLAEARSRGASERFPTEVQGLEARLASTRAALAEGRPEPARELGIALKTDLLELHKRID